MIKVIKLGEELKNWKGKMRNYGREGDKIS